MSYDLSIRVDQSYSRATPRQPLAAFLAGLPHVTQNGTSGFVLDDRAAERWMEIDPELVSEQGDNIEEDDELSPEVNCLRLHVPYGHYHDGKFDEEYLPTALAIARFLNWTLVDEQTGRTWKPARPVVCHIRSGK